MKPRISPHKIQTRRLIFLWNLDRSVILLHAWRGMWTFQTIVSRSEIVVNLFCPLRSQSWRVVPLIRLALLALRVAQVCILKRSKGVLQLQVNFFKAQANVKARASTWSPSSKFMRLIQSTQKRATTFTCTCTCFFLFLKHAGTWNIDIFLVLLEKVPGSRPLSQPCFGSLQWGL